MEATGGYALLAVAALAAAALPVVVVNPRPVRDVARATGPLAKTDRVDAEMLARFADVVRPKGRVIPDAAVHERDALLTRRRRRQLLEMRQAARHRVGQVFGTGKKPSGSAPRISCARMAHDGYGSGRDGARQSRLA